MSHTQDRPTHKELSGKLRVAKDRLDDGKWQPVNYRAFVEDCEELNLQTAEERIEALKKVMEEITPEHYIGRRPPLKGNRGDILEVDLFEFEHKSGFLNERIYFKFAVGGAQLFIVSFHKSRK